MVVTEIWKLQEIGEVKTKISECSVSKISSKLNL